MKPWEVEGISTDDKYDIEEYAEMMKAFALAATEGNLEQVTIKAESIAWRLIIIYLVNNVAR